MAQDFTLRLITRQAGGGEIVRTRKVEFRDVLIGRAPDNDIVLQDLSIDLQHARISRTGPRRIVVESTGESAFTMDGRAATRLELEIASEPQLQFGAYDITITPGEDGDVVVTVARDEEEETRSVSLFSLRAAVFGRRRMAWIYGLLVLSLCLLAPAGGALFMGHLKIHPDRQWSSGPLSRSHAFLEDNCQSCHQKAFVSVRDEACLTCHAAKLDTADRARLATRLKAEGSPDPALLVAEHAPHDRLRRSTPWGGPAGAVKAVFRTAFNHPANRCASCHLEHQAAAGPDRAQTPDKGPDKAPRAETPALVMSNTCVACHADIRRRLKDTDLPDAPDWARHPGFRPLVMVSPGAQPTVKRIAVASRPQENSGLIFPHRLHLDPTGGAARQAIALGAERGYGGALQCDSCHRPDASGTHFRPIRMERDCGSCHSLAYAGGPNGFRTLPHGDVAATVAALQATGGPGAARGAFSPGGLCYDCHKIAWAGDQVRLTPVKLVTRFLPHGGFDHSVPAHRGQGQGAAACADCHAAKTSDKSADLLMPDIARCATCHGKTKTQTPAAATADCESCHSFHDPGRAPVDAQDRLLEAIRGSWGKD